MERGARTWWWELVGTLPDSFTHIHSRDCPLLSYPYLKIAKKTLDHFMRSLFLTDSKRKEVTQRLSGKTPTPLVKGELALLPINKVQCY